MASLEQVPINDFVGELVHVLQKDGQDSLPVRQMLLRYAECKRTVVDLDVRLYLPAGQVDQNGTFVMYIPTHRGNALLHTLDQDRERVVRQIRSVSDLDWWSGICLGPTHDKFDPIIQLLMDQEHLRNSMPNPCYNMAMPIEKALQIQPVVPDGFELRPLTADDADFVNDRWPHKDHHTLAYIRDALRISDGIALCNKATGERVSWCMHSLVGGIGMIKTPDVHRSRGYGEVVAAAMTRQIARAGMEPQVQIITLLQNSMRLFSRQCQMLEMHAECRKALPSIDMRLYTPGGKVDHYGTFLLYIPEHRGNITFHTMYDDEDDLLKCLCEVDIEYEVNAWFGPVHERFLPLMLRLQQEKQLTAIVPPNTAYNLTIPRLTALALPVKVPDHVELRPVTLDDAEFIDERWPHRDQSTIHYIRNNIRVRNGVALCDKATGEMLSWALFCLVGGIGMIQTSEQHRGKGYAELVARQLTVDIAKTGVVPQVQVNIDIKPSYSLFQKIGYVITHHVQWYRYRRMK